MKNPSKPDEIALAALSLGSNIGHKEHNLRKALSLLAVKYRLVGVSSLYRASPVDDGEQTDFYNLCALIRIADPDPYELLDAVRKIEDDMGRKRDARRPKGPRVIDIDIIFFGDLVTAGPGLNIPHPEFMNRKFVLEPLLEILPKGSIYIKKYRLTEHLKNLNGQRVEKIGELSIGK